MYRLANMHLFKKKSASNKTSHAVACNKFRPNKSKSHEFYIANNLLTWKATSLLTTISIAPCITAQDESNQFTDLLICKYQRTLFVLTSFFIMLKIKLKLKWIKYTSNTHTISITCFFSTISNRTVISHSRNNYSVVLCTYLKVR